MIVFALLMGASSENGVSGVKLARRFFSSSASDSPRLRRISRSEAETDEAGEKTSQIFSSYKRDTASRRNWLRLIPIEGGDQHVQRLRRATVKARSEVAESDISRITGSPRVSR